MEFIKDAVREGMNAQLMRRLDLVELLGTNGLELKITEGYREGMEGEHDKGNAVDIRCWDAVTRLQLVEALLFVGFRRILIYDRHIHVAGGEQDAGILLMGASK